MLKLARIALVIAIASCTMAGAAHANINSAVSATCSATEAGDNTQVRKKARSEQPVFSLNAMQRSATALQNVQCADAGSGRATLLASMVESDSLMVRKMPDTAFVATRAGW
ncbi:hypothetical protein [Aestuariibacter salexigens]|uniref:hypothetical protein n=1 Tax=Aestuariibacter salexigens TaxID=226010 RepID=UPI000416C39D|nr:hypothetical protein [Aestuariibacter salexigens]